VSASPTRLRRSNILIGVVVAAAAPGLVALPAAATAVTATAPPTTTNRPPTKTTTPRTPTPKTPTKTKIPASVGGPAFATNGATANISTDAADLCARVATAAGFSRTVAVTAVAVAMAESACNPSASSSNNDSYHSKDRGLWQINSYWHPEVSDTCAYDARCNAGAAYTISTRGSDWAPWATYSAGTYKRYLTQAQAAVSRFSQGSVKPAGPAVLYGSGTSAYLFDWTSTDTAFPSRTTRWSSSTFAVADAGNRFAAGDFTGDGRTDVAAAYQNPDGSFRFYVWPAGGTTATSWYSAAGFSLAGVGGRLVAGDFNGDGKDDLAFLRTNGTGGAALWRFLSTGRSFTMSVTWQAFGYDLGQIGDRVAAGDFDGDGVADLAAAYQYPDGTYRIHVWRSAASYSGAGGWYSSGSAFSLASVGSRMAAGDCNGDGRDDVVLVASLGSSGAAIWRYLSSGSGFRAGLGWSSAAGYALGNVAGRVALGDANADGLADLVAAYQYPDGTFRYHLWTGATTYTGPGGWYVSPGIFRLSYVADRLVMGTW